MSKQQNPEIPTKPGWYRSRSGSDWMLFTLNHTGQWHAHVQNGDVTPCTADYALQCGDLVPVRRGTTAASWAWLVVIGAVPLSLAFWLVTLAVGALR